MEKQKKVIKVILVDDHALMRIGIRTSLINFSSDIQVIAEAESAEELFEELKTMTPDIILLDIILPGISGIEIAQRLRDEYGEIKILMLSAATSEKDIFDLLHIGIDGFVSKQMPVEELAKAIHAVYEGETYYGKDIANIIRDIHNACPPSQNINFTERELEVIKLCCDGLLCKEIADKLFVSVRTVEVHKANIFKKLGINNSVELVRYALHNGIIKL
ncbi:MAG: response regulator transcription factor [Bacteroidales bacterium]|nr:response regulator transcription factor [Bacteroidales bacterium]MDD4476517.1 response regulator transcription factor [Eubacteriales bacterium]